MNSKNSVWKNLYSHSLLIGKTMNKLFNSILSFFFVNKINKINKMNVGILYSKTSATVPYQKWAEEVLPQLPNIDEVNVTLINARDSIVNPWIDMLIIVGGADINSVRYNQKPSITAGSPNIDLEWWDTVMLPQYIQRSQKDGMSILGVCRGMQTLNVHFGGGMIQDFPQENSGDQRWKLVDKLDCVGEYVAKYAAFRKEIKEISSIIEVNSLHHQICCNPPACIDVVAINQKFKNIEAFRHKELPIIGVQFHPEECLLSSFMRFLLTYVTPKVCEI